MSETVEVDKENLQTVLEYIDELDADAKCPMEIGEAKSQLEEDVYGWYQGDGAHIEEMDS